MWEKAIELGKQLAKMHESQMFDFMELSQLLVSDSTSTKLSSVAARSRWRRAYRHTQFSVVVNALNHFCMEMRRWRSAMLVVYAVVVVVVCVFSILLPCYLGSHGLSACVRFSYRLPPPQPPSLCKTQRGHH